MASDTQLTSTTTVEPPAETLLGDAFRRDMLAAFLGLAALAVLAFGVLRALRGEWVAMAVDGVIAVAIFLIARRARQGGDFALLGTLGASICALGCLLSALAVGRTALYWAFLVIWVSTLVVPLRTAFAVSTLLTAALALIDSLHGSLIERLSFLVTAALSMGFAALFAHRLRAQSEALAMLAHFDVLTGAASRRAFEIRARHGEARAPMVLAIVDLDHFKEANDRLGHDAGDRLLAALGRTVRARIRKTDEFFRYGGDEFVLVLPDLALARAGPLLEDLRQRINRALAEAGWPCTVSIGATELLPGEPLSAAFPRADAALRRAKEGGRNRIEGQPATTG